jgi:K+-sensing histidine kinase KdpD
MLVISLGIILLIGLIFIYLHNNSGKLKQHQMENKTFFAPALRSSIEEILKENEIIATQKLFSEIFGAMAGISAILNKNRQIVFANNDFLKFLGVNSIENVLGKRPGEVVSCINSTLEQAGCGTSQACKYCGAVNAIMESQKTNSKSSRETRISSEIEGKKISWDLNVTSTPITMANMTFYVLSLQDISNEKKLMALERVFFHDLLNTAGGLNGLLTILKMGTDPDEARDLIVKSEGASQAIIEEIVLYRQLRSAENGDIQVKIEKVNSVEFLTSTISRISYHDAGKGKLIIIEDDSDNTDFQTDRILLQRVIINLLMNALEATPVNGVVKTGIKSVGEKILFTVSNSGVMTHEVQMQIFQRSFSTKGRNRGIGTYSIRLMTENYLRGKVSFVSNKKEGTVFTVELKKTFQTDIAD